ncbi:MAG: PEP-CTERM sorting domain-containing protein [Phycisphaerales bacterium]|nr:MAG: PEP-CTERM sorting domain-containing protein [Phycisphaerales bacterium]
MMRYVIALMVTLLVVCPVRKTFAETIILSTHSSDESPAFVLDATLEFIVVDSTLTLEVTNDTTAPDTFDISEVHFNVLESAGVTALALISPTEGWFLRTNVDTGMFGVFDFTVIDGVGEVPTQILPGETEAFTFDISGGGPFYASDFTSDFSTIPPGDMPALAAAKFVDGPDMDSAYGAYVPEPGSLSLLALGLTLFTFRRRTHR